MKLKYFITSLLASVVLLPACVEVDDINRLDGIGTAQLNVKGFLVGSTDGYPSIIDSEAGTITIQVPYYISDTERIMGDLTQMKIEAQTPVGYSFSPSLSGIHDLMAGYRTNLLDDKGNAKSFTIYAEMVKSSASQIISAKLLESERTAVVIREPETPGAHGQVIVAKTSSAIDGALHEVELNVSPWSTVTCTALDSETGLVDFSSLPEITVTAQNGIDKTVYDVKIQIPDVLPYGIGYISSMWAKQLYTDNDEGWEAGANTSMAVVDDYLIVSNVNDYRNMLVFDRFNGKRLHDVKVNCDGVADGRILRAITHDDANHMVAVTLTSNSWMNTPTNVLVYVWKDGITQKPTPVLNADINGSYFSNIPGRNSIDLFCVTSCAGDMVNGDAVLTTVYRGHYGPAILLPFKDGKPEGTALYDTNGAYASTWDSSNAAPISGSAPYGYIMHTGNARGLVSYVPRGTGSRAITFKRPLNHWWGNSETFGDWCGNTRSVDYIEFNGCHLVAACNGNNTGGNTEYQRLYVTNIGASPTADSFRDGFIFDSREGSVVGDASKGGPSGTGYGVAGMTSAYSYESGKTVLGDCFGGQVNRGAGNVIFARSTDGNAVQVYMLVPDHGILSYEMTRFDI